MHGGYDLALGHALSGFGHTSDNISAIIAQNIVPSSHTFTPELSAASGCMAAPGFCQWASSVIRNAMETIQTNKGKKLSIFTRSSG